MYREARERINNTCQCLGVVGFFYLFEQSLYVHHNRTLLFWKKTGSNWSNDSKKKWRNIASKRKATRKRNKRIRWYLVYCFRQRLNVFTVTFFIAFTHAPHSLGLSLLLLLVFCCYSSYFTYFRSHVPSLRCSLLWWLLTSMLSAEGILLMILKCLALDHQHKSIFESFEQRTFWLCMNLCAATTTLLEGDGGTRNFKMLTIKLKVRGRRGWRLSHCRQYGSNAARIHRTLHERFFLSTFVLPVAHTENPIFSMPPFKKSIVHKFCLLHYTNIFHWVKICRNKKTKTTTKIKKK